jgi:hypothetical protein
MMPDRASWSLQDTPVILEATYDLIRLGATLDVLPTKGVAVGFAVVEVGAVGPAAVGELTRLAAVAVARKRDALKGYRPEAVIAHHAVLGVVHGEPTVSVVVQLVMLDGGVRLRGGSVGDIHAGIEVRRRVLVPDTKPSLPRDQVVMGPKAVRLLRDVEATGITPYAVAEVVMDIRVSEFMLFVALGTRALPPERNRVRGVVKALYV